MHCAVQQPLNYGLWGWCLHLVRTRHEDVIHKKIVILIQSAEVGVKLDLEVIVDEFKPNCYPVTYLAYFCICGFRSFRQYLSQENLQELSETKYALTQNLHSCYVHIAFRWFGMVSSNMFSLMREYRRYCNDLITDHNKFIVITTERMMHKPAAYHYSSGPRLLVYIYMLLYKFSTSSVKFLKSGTDLNDFYRNFTALRIEEKPP
ncbi:hypothetical protein QE152_g36820 [Popillia japonica]|uniref:Uncharacterized protein n=1 Tax=Popillia japonica TaxID=7064 RepID=A0AAW1ICB4_POPJA